MKELDLFQVLADAVRYHKPQAEAHKELKTFSFIQNKSALLADNLNRTGIARGKPYFYSKKWEAMGYSANSVDYEFPAIFLMKFESPVTNLGEGPAGSICHSYQAMCLYPNVDALPENIQARCKAMETEEIEAVTRDHLLYALRTAGRAEYATTDVNPDGRWYIPGMLSALRSSGEISAYTVDKAATQKFQKHWQNETRQATLRYLDNFGTHKLSGVFLNFRFCEPYCEDVAAPDFTGITAECCVQR